MTWSYVSPGDSDRDHVRFLIGDVEQDSGTSISDETIDDLLVIYDSVAGAALEAAKHIRARLARLPSSRTVQGITATRTVSDMDLVIRDLESRLNRTRGGIGVFGLTKTDRKTIEDDTDFIRPFAREGRDWSE